jgi:hypothetical protein
LEAHTRITTNLKTIRQLTPTLIADLEYCTRAVPTRRQTANNLDRINSRTGECETCYTAGRPDSHQHGTLETVTLATHTTIDGQPAHEQLDLCHNCAVSARGSRAAARSSGTDWNPDEWAAARIERLRTTTTTLRDPARDTVPKT